MAGVLGRFVKVVKVNKFYLKKEKSPVIKLV